MKIICETDKLSLEHEFEATFLFEKRTGRVLLQDDFYGDPKLGLIDSNHQWAIVAGEHLTIWTPKLWKRIDDKDLRWIHCLRVKNDHTVEILTDPWSRNASIWEIDTGSLGYKKIRDFNDYRDREYTETVDW
jgi:hypothetical protein